MGRRGGGGAGENEAFHCADKWCARLSPLSSPAIAFDPLHQRSARADRHFARSRLQASSVCTAHSCVQQLMNCITASDSSFTRICLCCVSSLSTLFCAALVLVLCNVRIVHEYGVRVCVSHHISYSTRIEYLSAAFASHKCALIGAHKKNCLCMYCGELWRVLSG